MRRLHAISMALLLLVSLTGGCALHAPQEVTLPAPLPAAFSEEGGSLPSAALKAHWWRVFNDSGLNELMEATFAGNLDLPQAYARLEQFEAGYRKSLAAERPVINLEGEAGLSEQLAGGTTGLAGTSSVIKVDTYRVSLAAGYEIDAWRKLKSRTQAGRLRAKASLEDIKTLYLTLSAEAADLYYLIAELRAQIELTDRTIASYSDTLQRVENRYREGLVPSVDVYQARQNLSAAESGRPDLETRLAAAGHALSVLAGAYPGRQILSGPVVLPHMTAAFPAGLPSELLLNRPDIQAALLRLKARDAEIAAAVADRFPAFNLLVQYGRAGSSSGYGSVSGAVWNLAGSLFKPLLDWGARKAEVERTQAVFREDLFVYRQKVLRAFQEVEDALAAGRLSEVRIARLAEREKASSAALHLSTERYMQGLSEYLPVLTNQILHFDARRKLLSSRRQLISDRISLARALGGAWMQRETEKRLQTGSISSQSLSEAVKAQPESDE